MRVSLLLRSFMFVVVALAVFAPGALATSSEIEIAIDGELAVRSVDGGNHALTVVKDPVANEWTITDATLGATMAPDPGNFAALTQCSMLTANS